MVRGVSSGFLAAGVLCVLASEGAAQCQHKLVAGLQRVGQHGRHRAGLAERGSDDESVASPRLLPGGQQDAAAGGGIGSGLQASDPVLTEQRVVVAHHAGHRDDGAGRADKAGSTGPLVSRPLMQRPVDPVTEGVGGLVCECLFQIPEDDAHQKVLLPRFRSETADR